MGKWNYDDLSDDVEELTRNLLQLNEKNRNRQIIMRSDITLPQPFASWSNSL